ncbi:hypothetical protein AK812_SmicGene28672 [Symbiodinium microadriaticum]|uniref:Uncharacterized protein n=1 Tax=Symbiodinium microadriaticum TaxID=2951 RepID=A0A1Q9D3R1_SYMMI|nr:hypothetical protein AK812_SmicGene28672 [Symbiodinium microadriaticum]
MAPKPPAKAKGSGKAVSKDNLAPTTKLEFGYPQALTTALQAISSRATHDLWHAPSLQSGDPTAEQIAQRHANILAKLSKRLVGDMKAKEELASALSQWAMTIGQHLAQLVERVRALSSKLDEDLIEACSETETMTTGASLATTERLQQARAALGPIWTIGQEQELFRIAACLRAFGTVADEAAVAFSGNGDPSLQMIARGNTSGLSHGAALGSLSGSDGSSGPRFGNAPSFQGSSSTVPAEANLVQPAMASSAAAPPLGGRWQKHRCGPRPERPSKSARRDVAAGVPWVAPVTGRSPEGLSRVPGTQIDEDEELLPDTSTQPLSWFASWLRLVGFAISNGSEQVGDLAKHPQQDALLPLSSDSGLRERALGLADEAWALLQSVTASGDGSGVADLYMVLQDALQHLRLCPEVLPQDMAKDVDVQVRPSPLRGCYFGDGSVVGGLTTFLGDSFQVWPLARVPALRVLAGEPGATPARRLRAAVADMGEPLVDQSVEQLVLSGRFRVLHREVLVDPQVALRTDPPIVLVVTPATAPITVSAAHLQQLRDRRQAGLHRDPANGCASCRISSGLVCLIVSSRFGAGVFGCVFSMLLPWVSAGNGDDVEWGRYEPEGAPTLQEQPARYPGLASLGAHRRLSDILYAHFDCRSIGGPLAASAPHDRSVFCVELWSPASRLRAFFPASVTTQGLRSKVKQASELPRGTPVLVHPQMASRSVQFVSPSTSPQIVTIIVDTGLDWHCIDVPRAGTGQAMLDCMCQLRPGSEYRLGSHPTLALRHGDVILACQDVLAQPLAGIIRLPQAAHTKDPSGEHTEVAVSAADLGLIRVRVPSRATKEGIMSALTQWLGRQRCLSVGLHQVQAPGSAVQLFCLPRRERSTLTAVLTDLEAENGAVFVTTVDDVPGEALTCAALATASDGPSVDWYLSGSERISVSTQTTPSHWPVPASPLYSDGLPVRRRPDGCALAPGMFPAGTLHHLDCPHFGVYCTIPCVPGYKLWALRLGQWVRGACTAVLTWNEVMAAASMTPWDLSGSMIHGENQVWVWPADVASLEGQCGHLFHEGSDPYLCGLDVGTSSPAPAAEPEPAASNRGLRFKGWLSMWGSLLVLAAEPQLRWPSFGLVLLHLLTATAVRSPVASSDTSGAQAGGGGYDTTQPCNIGWCHELACQTTHLAVSSRHLLTYFAQHSPYAAIRVSLWTPYRGPVLFDIHRGSQLSEFDEFLLVSGHDPDRHSLFVAFDTHATSPDLLSVPTGDTVWWLVRDGLSRELMRPVTPWYEPPHRLVATINSHGQASTVTFSPEVSTMRRLPQGARGNTAVPLSTVIGHLTAQGLVLMEIAIGSLTSARELTRSHACTSSLLLLAWLPFAWGMQPAQDLAVRNGRRADPWGGAARAAPAFMRIWRGVSSTGEFIWTQPRIVQDVAHILHIPMGAYPTLVFWLLHYRARATVVAAAPGTMDWGLVGQTAHEAFGEGFFARGCFSIQYHSGVIGYGTAVTPPHGAILHLVRAVTVPQASANIWEPTAEPAYVSHFDYDICMGPRGEPTLVEGDQVTGQSGAAHSQNLARSAEAASLARQVNHISHQLDTLTLRLESVGVLPSSDAEEVPATGADANAEPGDRSACIRHAAVWLGPFLSLVITGGRLRIAIALGFSLHGIPRASADGSEGSDSGPAEPSSPDLDDLQPPTPAASEPPTLSAMPILRPSGSSLASTSAPFEGPEAPLPVAFSRDQVPAVQRRVAAVLQGVDVEPGPVPFLPAGCSIFIHNPFTGQTQCPALSSRVGTSHQLTEVLQDYSDRRGWQPIVSVQPQPDAQGVHFIPSAANARFVSVLFRNGQELRPRCIERDFIYGPDTEVPFGDRTGRLRVPYPVRRGSPRTLRLRDGDCLHIDTGPYGPPPPQPASLMRRHKATEVIHSHREIESRGCRHGAFQVDPAEDVAFVQARFAQLLPPPRTLMPVWPAPRQDCLTMVPGLGCSSPFACVFAIYEGHSRTLLVPRSLAVAELCRVIQYLTCWPFDAIRLPPALWARLRDHPQASAHLRDGDVLDVLREEHARDVVLRDSALLKDHTLWTRTIRFSVPVAVRLWLPDVLHPVLTWISAGEAWTPERCSFTGRFPVNYPGTWIPVTWCPCTLPHLVRASDRLSTVTVLHDSVDGVRSISTVPDFRASDCADDFHTLPQHFHVLGASHGADEDVLLRDGDVLWDSFMYPDDALGPWASSDILGDPTVASLAGALIGKRSLWLYVLLQSLRVQGSGAVRSLSPTRSRSVSRGQMRSSSPRFGSWRPDHSQPMQSVINRYRCDYRVLCPFRGGRFRGYFLPDTTCDSLLSIVTQATGSWATGFVLVAPAQDGEDCLLCPTCEGELVTIILSAGGRKISVLVPRHFTWNELLALFQRLTGLWGTDLQVPPALKPWGRWPANHLQLRHGDCFSIVHDPDHPVFEGRPLGTFSSLQVLPHRSATLIRIVTASGFMPGVCGEQPVVILNSVVSQLAAARVIIQQAFYSPSLECRLLTYTGQVGYTARLWSPFAVDNEAVSVSPDTTVEDVRLDLASSEPAWSLAIVPVWPTLWQQTLTFVPSTGDMPLAVVMVVSSEWQFAALIPGSLAVGCRSHGHILTRLSRESAAGMMHTTIDMISVLGIAEVDLHSFWCSHPLSSTLPMSLPAPYHCAWEAFPQWAGGVPHEILISTDGSAETATEKMQVDKDEMDKLANKCDKKNPRRGDQDPACLQSERTPAVAHLPGNSNTSPGTPVAAGEWLWHLCTGILLSGHEPAGFKRALICALYKKGPASVPSNYRSIALLNGTAKIWHSHVRKTAGQSVLGHYDEFQLGGRSGVPVAFAVAAFRNAWELSSQAGRYLSVLFVDIQAAYYEASRQLIFQGDADLRAPDESYLQHLSALASQLAHSGALSILGVQPDEIALLQAKAVRRDILGEPSSIVLPTGDHLRVAAEYRYLGVVQTPRDTGRRDTELCAHRAQAAWAHARSMLASGSVPWALKQAWVAGRVLPAAYATIATNIATSARATAPLSGFFERAVRQLAGSWCYGHVLTTPLLFALGGLSAPEHATLIARVRLTVQIAARAPTPVQDLFDAAWSRGTPWTELLREGRGCTAAELEAELVQVTGASSTWDWPSPPHLGRPEAVGPSSKTDQSHAAGTPPNQPSVACTPAGAAITDHRAWRWWTVCDASHFRHDDLHCPSPFWKGLQVGMHVWQLPRSWHNFWAMWRQASRQQPWAFDSRKGLAPLRMASSSLESQTEGPAVALTDILAATVTLRHICAAVERTGILWMLGYPSSVGLLTLRELMPSVVFHFISLSSFRVFAAARREVPKELWLEQLKALFSTHAQVLSPKPLMLRSSMVYHARSLNAGALL